MTTQTIEAWAATHAKLKPDFRVLSVENAGSLKMSLDVEASRRFGKAKLTFLARGIYKSVQGSEYRLFFITWYLPGMKRNSGAWATTHFTPLLQVKITEWMLEYNPPEIQYSQPIAQ